ncbi:MAG: MTH938/NDUFAF3 family protein, partial [Actinomycetota bacterium]
PCGIMGSMTRISSYRFGHIVVDGDELTRDVIVLPDRVVRNWWRNDGHRLVRQDLAEVWAELPPRLVVGTGASGRMELDPTLLETLRARGIEVECLPTGRAVERFGELAPATAAAALHLTC